MIREAILAAIIPATAPPQDVGLPARADVQAAYDLLDKCRGRPEPPCLPPERTYVIHDARCTAIAPQGGQPAVACRVDFTMTDTVPELEVTRYRDRCTRFVQDARGWTIARDQDRPCEMASILPIDPHPRPGRADMERVVMGAYGCYADDDASDCFVQPVSAVVRTWQCRPLSPSDKGEPRAICRVNGVVTMSSTVPLSFRNLCIRLKRYTDRGVSPAFWGTDFIEGAPPCEAEWQARR